MNLATTYTRARTLNTATRASSTRTTTHTPANIRHRHSRHRTRLHGINRSLFLCCARNTI